MSDTDFRSLCMFFCFYTLFKFIGFCCGHRIEIRKKTAEMPNDICYFGEKKIIKKMFLLSFIRESEVSANA